MSVRPSVCLIGLRSDSVSKQLNISSNFLHCPSYLWTKPCSKILTESSSTGHQIQVRYNKTSRLTTQPLSQKRCKGEPPLQLNVNRNSHERITFLADRTNDRAYATMLRPSVCRLSVVCDLCIVATGKRFVLQKKLYKKQIENGLWGIEWSRDRWRHVTLRGQDHDPNKVQYLENSWRCYSGTTANH